MSEVMIYKLLDSGYKRSEANDKEIIAHSEKCVHNLGVLGRIAGSSPQLEINDHCFLFLYNVAIKQDLRAALECAKKVFDAFRQTPADQKFSSWYAVS